MRIHILSTAIILSYSSCLYAESINIEAPVTSATLYLQGADIIREAQVHLPHTPNESATYQITIPKIHDLQQINIQGATLLSQAETQYSNELAENTPLMQAQNALAEIKATLQHNNTLLTQLANSLAKQPELLDTIRKDSQSLLEQNQRLREKRQLQQQLVTQLEKKAKQQPNRQNLVLEIGEIKQQDIKITLREYTPTASWSPSSQLNLNTKEKTLSLKAYAKLQQQSLSDWKDVKLTLALTPVRDARLPSLHSRSISAVLPPKEDMALNRTETTPYGSLSFSAEMPAPAVEAFALKTSAPIIESNGIDFQIILPNHYQLHSGETSSVPYYQQSISADIYSAVYQWAQPEAILVAKWKQPKELNFLPGEMQILRDNLTIGKRYENHLWQIDSEQKLSFGIDPAFKVTKTVPPNYTDENGIFNKQHVQEVRENFTITNLNNTQRPLYFYAQLPIAGNSDTKITPKLSLKPDIENVDGIKGILQWKVPTITSNKPWKLDFGYDISYPQNMTLIPSL
ncbi:DUF4139 domain-containing protein [Suttonella ornithocola]|uniref:DUF4139 domain-containing protein n=1 Tax=Suttonella ornithocola TaxID=279832 RepID=A0A380MSC1_9GAMM|nr:DUF4139 domain-containing protein [Suttonella ornithocola]SUO95529.1 Uncharacterised protein [Suttonella ornithocola]